MPDVLLDVQNLTHIYKLPNKAEICAVDDISFKVEKGEIFGLVGESGCGKSTVARCIMNICNPTGGKILYDNIDICSKKEFRKNRKFLQTSRQMIFQDSSSSLNQRMKVADIISEPLRINHITPKRETLYDEAKFQMQYVGMDASYLNRYPPELSGGQRQRVAIARALAMEPKLLVADEAIALLDVSIQAQIVNLFKHLQKEHGFTFIFIAHDLSMVKYICDRVAVMYKGKIVELAPCRELFSNPVHEYTKCLLSAIPIPDPIRERERTLKLYNGNLSGSRFDEVSPNHYVLK